MVKKTKLKNGLHLLTAPLKGTAAVTVLVLVPVGSRHETPDINGVSHFVEHLFFKGTKKRPTSLDITKELDSVGAEFNAFTSKDHTGYYIKSSADKIELAFDILSDMLFNSLFDPTELDKERGVIVEEINMYNDNPLMSLQTLFEETIFQGNSLGWDIAGPKKVIKTVPRNKVVTYKDKHYFPGNMIVSVAGKINETKVEKLAKKYFGQTSKSKKISSFKKFKPTQTKPQIKIKTKDTKQVQLGLGFPSYAKGDPKMYPLYLLSAVLGGNMSSRLFSIVREKNGLAYFVKTDISAYQDVGNFMVQSGLDKSRLVPAIKLILSELKRARDFGITQKELADAKAFIKGKVVLSLEDSENVADWFGKQMLFNKKTITPEQRIKKIEAVSLKQVQVVAKEIIRADRINLSLIGPFSDKNQFLPLLKF